MTTLRERIDETDDVDPWTTHDEDHDHDEDWREDDDWSEVPTTRGTDPRRWLADDEDQDDW